MGESFEPDSLDIMYTARVAINAGAGVIGPHGEMCACLNAYSWHQLKPLCIADTDANGIGGEIYIFVPIAALRALVLANGTVPSRMAQKALNCMPMTQAEFRNRFHISVRMELCHLGLIWIDRRDTGEPIICDASVLPVPEELMSIVNDTAARIKETWRSKRKRSV